MHNSCLHTPDLRKCLGCTWWNNSSPSTPLSWVPAGGEVWRARHVQWVTIQWDLFLSVNDCSLLTALLFLRHLAMTTALLICNNNNNSIVSSSYKLSLWCAYFMYMCIFRVIEGPDEINMNVFCQLCPIPECFRHLLFCTHLLSFSHPLLILQNKKASLYSLQCVYINTYIITMGCVN